MQRIPDTIAVGTHVIKPKKISAGNTMRWTNNPKKPFILNPLKFNSFVSITDRLSWYHFDITNILLHLVKKTFTISILKKIKKFAIFLYLCVFYKLIQNEKYSTTDFTFINLHGTVNPNHASCTTNLSNPALLYI